MEIMDKNESLEIPWINEPEDILGIGFRNLLSYRYDDPVFHELVEKLNQEIIFDFEDLYAVSVKFCKPTIEITPFEIQTGPTGLGMKMSMPTLIAIMKGKYSMVGAFLRGKIRIFRWWKLLSIIRLMKLLLPTLQRAKERAEEYGK